MSVIRVKHEKKYVVINKTALEDTNLSFKAKGFWAYCMSRPDDWEFHVSHLKNVSRDGKDSIYSTIKELVEFGYCERILNKNEKGQFEHHDYIIYEEPFKKCLPQTGFPDTDNPDTGKPDTDNPPLLSKDNNQVMTSHQRGEVIPARGKSDTYIGTLQERVDFLKTIFFPGGKTISQRNVETWSRNYSLWRLMKASVKNVHMIEDGKSLDNPEGYFAKMLQDPYMESTESIEKLRSDLYMWIRNRGKLWRVDGDYVVATDLDKELSFEMGYERIIEEMERWIHG